MDMTSDLEAILRFSDDAAKVTAFDHCWKKLESASSHRIDLDTLRTCVRLLPPFEIVESSDTSYENLRNLVTDIIPKEINDAERLYLLADVCFVSPQLGHQICTRLFKHMTTTVRDSTIQDGLTTMEVQDEKNLVENHTINVVSYLRFLKCSYWRPLDGWHFVTAPLLRLLVSMIGNNDLDDDVHDTLSAFLSLLARSSTVVLEQPQVATATDDKHSTVLQQNMVDGSLFIQFEKLSSEYFHTNAGKAFRTWFQWISQAINDGTTLGAIYTSFYWSTLRTGLLAGFADQRKYCLGILRQSLLLPRYDIDTPHMTLNVQRRSEYVLQYEKFSTLFETIVLDRYVNQVQACLPELSALLGSASLISSTWVTALLSAALNPKVQEGIRKLIGNWYMDYVIQEQGTSASSTALLIGGLLPWATQGSMFTSTLVSSRTSTHCTHGAALVAVIARFIATAPTDEDRRHTLRSVLSYVWDTGGNMFAPSILFLLEGLLKGLKLQPVTLEATDIELIFRISRNPALPEAGFDLCGVYCAELASYIDAQTLRQQDLSTYNLLKAKYNRLEGHRTNGWDNSSKEVEHQYITSKLSSLTDFINRLNNSQHKTIQDDAFGPACTELLAIFNKSESGTIPPEELLLVLDAMWEEAERQDYPRAVVISIPPVLFHLTCIRTCIQQHLNNEGSDSLVLLLSKALDQLQQLTEGRSYILPMVATSLRNACFSQPLATYVLPLEEVVVRLVNNPPSPKKDFLFEVFAAGQLQQILPHRNYDSYYGQREWHGYAAIVDLLNRFPQDQTAVAARIFDRLSEPWTTQVAPIPIISKWKRVLQLQLMLLLTESCVTEMNSDHYLKSFMHALVLEQWPRHRFLLEWIIARIYYRFSAKAGHILDGLAKLDDSSPIHIASLMKLALLVAPFLDSEDFTLRLMIQLIPFSASSKVQIRHEAHWSFPTLFRLAEERRWNSITSNPAFRALDAHIRGLEKFSALPWTIRTLHLDAVKDYTLTNIFQGRYLSIEAPELEHVAYDDFEALYANDCRYVLDLSVPPPRIPLGEPIVSMNIQLPLASVQTLFPASNGLQTTGSNPAFFQTKAGFNIASLLPTPSAPSAQTHRPASVIVIASLIDNPTNLGGLSRISESFGLETLYIDDLRKTAHKDFKATSVNSEKHLPIRELKVTDVPVFVVECKRNGYEVVGIEQTDRSGILGEVEGRKGKGTLPKKCVLVLGAEKTGISGEVLAVMDRCVEIPTVGFTRSLNVQTAGGIAVYEWWREWGGNV